MNNIASQSWVKGLLKKVIAKKFANYGKQDKTDKIVNPPWGSGARGLSAYHYEPGDLSYVPNAYVDVWSYMSNSNRGTAIAIQWNYNKSWPGVHLWVTHCHGGFLGYNDGEWYPWVQII